MSDRLVNEVSAKPAQQMLAYNDVMPVPRNSENPVEPHGPGTPGTPGAVGDSNASASAVATGSISNRQLFLNATPYSPALAGGGECTKSKSSGFNLAGLVGASNGESGPDKECLEMKQEIAKRQLICNTAVLDAGVATQMMDKFMQSGREFNTNPAARPTAELAGTMATKFAGHALQQAQMCDSLAGTDGKNGLPTLQIISTDLERTKPKPIAPPAPKPVEVEVAPKPRPVIHRPAPKPAPKEDPDCKDTKKK